MTHQTRKARFVPVSNGPQRVCCYLRVSTGRQAEGDLSIPDQRKQVHAFCAAKGWPVVGEYVEPGASATDDNRPEFQKMIVRAGDDDHPFDVIVVHSYSRFFRDSFGLEMYVRRLARAGVRLISITQELGDDPAQVMMRQVIALFDEYQSKENAKHVLRAMKENARQGFYNGSPVPLGYTVAEVEKRGARVKKRLTVDPVEAETVRLIFRLYRFGDGATGPLGVKAITCHLNERGYRTRAGARFGVATVHGILTNRVYIGEFVFNRRCSRTLAQKPAAEHIPITVPAIIELPEFEAVQATLKAHNPRATPARVVTGPILLTGLATCTTCNGPMTLRTGTSKSGKVHRYYSCSTHGRMGRTGCTGRSIPMDTLDTLVTDHLVTELLQPDRLRATLASLWALRAEKAAQVDGRVATLRGEVSEAEEKLKRLYRMVEEGVTDLDDILKGRLAALKEERDRARTALDRIHVAERAPAEIAPELVEKFGRLMRANVTSGEVPFRKAWLQAIVDRVEVDADVIRIVGDKAILEAAVVGAALSATVGVRSSVRKWRARKDSNL
ncbi:recombinase family protein [Methylobacterium isbiliense]|uniref:recombinase family protein n=1 Tax=Methylobacterium isbiliense TaxID=315478 RepID=UPI0025B40CCC|nr:recombinase family protein [Methylobacterium isbiliense]MDN3624867.1 recombinase family protein [Methylobacterium isbiliense]